MHSQTSGQGGAVGGRMLELMWDPCEGRLAPRCGHRLGRDNGCCWRIRRCKERWKKPPGSRNHTKMSPAIHHDTPLFYRKVFQINSAEVDKEAELLLQLTSSSTPIAQHPEDWFFGTLPFYLVFIFFNYLLFWVLKCLLFLDFFSVFGLWLFFLLHWTLFIVFMHDSLFIVCFQANWLPCVAHGWLFLYQHTSCGWEQCSPQVFLVTLSNWGKCALTP